MKAASLACLFLLAISSSVFGHGVERGSVRAGISASDLGLLSESTKDQISQVVEERCDLTGLISATAEIAESDEPSAETSSNELRVRLRLIMERADSPVIIIVKASSKGFTAAGGQEVLEYSVNSPVCR